MYNRLIVKFGVVGQSRSIETRKFLGDSACVQEAVGMDGRVRRCAVISNARISQDCSGVRGARKSNVLGIKINMQSNKNSFLARNLSARKLNKGTPIDCVSRPRIGIRPMYNALNPSCLMYSGVYSSTVATLERKTKKAKLTATPPRVRENIFI